MRLARLLLVGLLSAGLFLGCDDDDGAGPDGGISMGDLVGTWEIVLLEFTNLADESQSVDQTDFGVEGTLTATSAGDLAVVLVVPAAEAVAEVITGSVSVQSGNVVVTEDGLPGEEITFSATLSGGTLELTTDDQEFDFDGDGTDEPARQRVGLQRASGTTPADLAGTWTASEFRFISEPAGTDTLDVIDAGGGVTATFGADASFTAEVTFPGEPVEMQAGTCYMGDSGLWLIDETAAGDLQIFTSVALSGSTLSLETLDEIDIDDDGIDDPVTLQVVFQRQ